MKAAALTFSDGDGWTFRFQTILGYSAYTEADF